MKTYEGAYTKEISFPLGGIGTGSIGLDGTGRLIDWEIFNRPDKGSCGNYTHFAIKAIEKTRVTTYVLQGDCAQSLMGAHGRGNFRGYGFGPEERSMCGFPHFSNCVFEGEFPMAHVHLWDESFPARVTLHAFNPFIPGDEDESGIPAAFFEVEIENNTSDAVRYVPAFSVGGFADHTMHTLVREAGQTMIRMVNAGADLNDPAYHEMTVATDLGDAEWQTYWYRGGLMDAVVSYWEDFATSREPLKDRVYDTAGRRDRCTVAGAVELAPGERATARFVLSWSAPNNFNDWSSDRARCTHEDGTPITWKNYYATRFADSTSSAAYALTHWDTLYARTLRFTRALHDATLPPEVIDAASANLSVLKSPTVWRLEDGTFYGWEGVHEHAGSCEGTCQHVWNYAYAMCYLFPRLERSIREAELRYSTEPSGRMGFRMMLPMGSGITPFRACLDGQMGNVLKFYREWRLSGDDAWLATHWQTIKRTMEYAWSEENPDAWDRDRDGVLEGRQHHTLDMELFGPSSWLEGMYLAALKAMEEMARALKDAPAAEEYGRLYEKGRTFTAEHLFNGSYFIQQIDLDDRTPAERFDAENYWNSERSEMKYQIAQGCSIDQLLGQWHADLLGLGDVFDPRQVREALKHMMQYNFKERMRDHVNPWRIFSLGDEAGSVICSYPEGSRKPIIPIPYCEETMTGFEYAFAGLLLSRGMWEEGLRVVRAVRARFDGEKRNPWNEFECGSNYARSMASYALLPILCGYVADLPNHRMRFSPYRTDAFRCPWANGEAWGEFSVFGDEILLSVSEGAVRLSALELPFCHSIRELCIDGEQRDFTLEDGCLRFSPAQVAKEIRCLGCEVQPTSFSVE